MNRLRNPQPRSAPHGARFVATRSRAAGRCVRVAAALLAASLCGSCTFLANEFAWLNTPGPVVEHPDDAAVRTVSDRP
ncbi:MAG: hypothetical protein AB8H80_15265 [Planctomycetota bacterium]